MITHNITLRVKDQNAVDTGIAVSQGDYGHVQFVMYAKDDDKYITDAEKAEVVFNTPNGYIVTGDAVIKDGAYTYIFVGNELQAPGKISATLTLTFSDGRASACNFVFECRYNALYDRGISAGNYITQIENLTQRAEEALSAADGAAALAEMAKIAAVAAQNAAEIAAANAEAVSGVEIATQEKAGLVKPDGTTTDVNAAGVLSVIMKAAGLPVTDTQGLAGEANAEIMLQAFVDVIADKVANQMLTKAGLVNNGLATQAGVAALDAAYGKVLADLIAANAASITQLNSERVCGKSIGTFTSENVIAGTGHVNADGTKAFLYFPMVWECSVSSVNIAELLSSIRTVQGTYLGGQLDANLVSYITSATILKSQGILQVILKNNDGWGVTSNTPLSGTCKMSYTIE